MIYSNITTNDAKEVNITLFSLQYIVDSDQRSIFPELRRDTSFFN